MPETFLALFPAWPAWIRPTVEDVSAFSQRRKFPPHARKKGLGQQWKFPPHARKTSGTQGNFEGFASYNNNNFCSTFPGLIQAQGRFFQDLQFCRILILEKNVKKKLPGSPLCDFARRAWPRPWPWTPDLKVRGSHHARGVVSLTRDFSPLSFSSPRCINGYRQHTAGG